MGFFKDIKIRKERGYVFVANPMIYSFKKPKLPLLLIESKNPIKKPPTKEFIIENIKQF
jgi:hypothetical protein